MEEINVKEFLKYLKKYIILIVIVVILSITGICVYNANIKVPEYTTYTTIVLTQSNETQINNTTITQNDILLNQKLVATYSQIIKSKLVLEQVISETGIDYKVKELEKNVSVTALKDTEILKISVTDPNKKRAVKIANTIAEIFSEEVSKLYKIDNINVVDVAEVSNEVSNNTFVRDVFLALFISLFGIVGILFVIYYFDDTIKLTENLEEEIGMPVVAKIFKSDIKTRKKEPKIDLILHKYPKALVSESIKTLRTNLQFSSVDTELETLLITSSVPGEGKSFISANLAISFTQTGKKVLIVDCDMRKGRQHKIFKLSNSKGLSNLLIDDIKNISQYVNKTSIKDLYVITRGAVPPNPSELLNSKRNKELIKLFKTKFDIVIFDGVPCNGLPDSIIMSKLVDKVLIVSSESVTPKSVLDSTKKELEKVDAPIAGNVLNKVNTKSGVYGRYYKYYGDNE